MTKPTFLIVGAILAGAKAAEELRDGCVQAGMNVNVWDVNEHVQALIRARQPVAAAVLADPATALDELARKLAAGR